MLDPTMEAIDQLSLEDARFMCKELVQACHKCVRSAYTHMNSNRGDATGGAGSGMFPVTSSGAPKESNRKHSLMSGTESPASEVSTFKPPQTGFEYNSPFPGEVFGNFSFGQRYGGGRRESTFSIVSAAQGPVAATKYLHMQETSDGSVMINQLLVLDDIVEGKVKLCYDQDAQEFRAVKVLKRPSAFNRTVLQEIAIMKKLRHKNIVTLHEVIDDSESQCLFLVMQYVEHGPLVELKEDGVTCATIEPFALVHYARQIAAGLTYLHTHGVVHNDLKPANILKGRDDQVFLADFGVAELVGEESEEGSEPDALNGTQTPQGHGSLPNMGGSPGITLETDHSLSVSDREEGAETANAGPSSAVRKESLVSPQSADLVASRTGSGVFAVARRGVGTPAFFAPELLQPKAAGEKLNDVNEVENDYLESGKATDIWALGVTFYMILTGHLPFQPLGEYARGSHQYWEEYKQLVLTQEIEYPEKAIPVPWKEILIKMLVRDPKERADIQTIRKMIKNINFAPVIQKAQPVALSVDDDRKSRRESAGVHSSASLTSPLRSRISSPAPGSSRPVSTSVSNNATPLGIAIGGGSSGSTLGTPVHHRPIPIMVPLDESDINNALTSVSTPHPLNAKSPRAQLNRFAKLTLSPRQKQHPTSATNVGLSPLSNSLPSGEAPEVAMTLPANANMTSSQ